MSRERQSLWQKVQEMEIHSERSPWVCVCVCVCVCVICVYVCLLGDTCNIDGFYFRTVECSKNILFTLLLLIHGHTHECSLYIHSLQRKLLFLLRVHPMGSSSVLIQYLNFFFF